MSLRSIVFCLVLLSVLPCCSAAEPVSVLTPLEKSGHTRLSASSEISDFLAQLAHKYPFAQRVGIGESACESPLELLLLSEDLNLFRCGWPSNHKVTVVLVGSQHGTEPSGGEAILLIARDAAAGSLRSYLKHMNSILLPNSNPDGRDLHRRGNGNGVNLSTNFTVLTEPERRALNDTLVKWKTEVVLDVHSFSSGCIHV